MSTFLASLRLNLLIWFFLLPCSSRGTGNRRRSNLAEKDRPSSSTNHATSGRARKRRPSMQCWRSLETRCLQSNGSKASKTSETKANVSRFGPTELPIKRYWELKDSSRRMKALTGVCSTMATARSSMNLASTLQVGPLSSAHFEGFCLTNVLSLCSGRWYGLSSHVDEEEEAGQKSSGGKKA